MASLSIFMSQGWKTRMVGMMGRRLLGDIDVASGVEINTIGRTVVSLVQREGEDEG